MEEGLPEATARTYVLLKELRKKCTLWRFISTFFLTANFFKILSSKTIGLDPDLGKYLDPDSVNLVHKQCFFLSLWKAAVSSPGCPVEEDPGSLQLISGRCPHLVALLRGTLAASS
jgi:hypothetical protein